MADNLKSSSSEVLFKNVLNNIIGKDFRWSTRLISFVIAYNDYAKRTSSPTEIRSMFLRDVQLKLLPSVPDYIVNNTIKSMACSYSLGIVRLLGYFLLKVLSKVLNNLYVNETSLLKIRSEMGDNPVIFLPTHRSYADFILMAFLCFAYDIELPCVAAGMDFHSMKIMGDILRNCKAFFMKRSFSEDETYRTIFRNYFHLLIEAGNSPIEFYIEGTRSRTGKSLAPKFGLISIVVEAYRLGKVPDVTLVPVSISYDRFLEERLFANELLGIPKPKESTLALVQALYKLKSNYGDVFFNFGHPISLREWIKENFAAKEEISHLTTRNINYALAHEIVRRQVDLQIIQVFNILAVIISNCISIRNSYEISMSEAVSEFNYFCELIRISNGSVFIGGKDIRVAISSACKIHSSLVSIEGDSILFNKCEPSPNERNGANFNLHHLLSSNLHLSEAVNSIMLQLYVNPCLHLFVCPGLILYSVQPSKVLYNGSLYDAFKFISSLFYLEFVTLTVDLQTAFNGGMDFLKRTECIIENENISNFKVESILKALFRPFILGYSVVVEVVSKLPHEDPLSTLPLILSQCQHIVEISLKQGLSHPYCLSRDLLKNAFDSLVSLNYVTKHSIFIIITANIHAKMQDVKMAMWILASKFSSLCEEFFFYLT